MWYLFALNGQNEIIMLTLKQIKAGRVEEIVLGKHPTATDIRPATDEEINAVIGRVRTEEKIQKQIDRRCPCYAVPIEKCECDFNG